MELGSEGGFERPEEQEDELELAERAEREVDEAALAETVSGILVVATEPAWRLSHYILLNVMAKAWTQHAYSQAKPPARMTRRG